MFVKVGFIAKGWELYTVQKNAKKIHCRANRIGIESSEILKKRKRIRHTYSKPSASEDITMAKKTGDQLPATRDGQGFESEADLDIDTKILIPQESAADTIEMGERAQRKHIVGSRISQDPRVSTGGYQILRKIGEGGMGMVYEAEQQHPRRLVALKVIRGGLYANEYHVKMFEREIQALARLKHPGIVSIYEAGRFDDGQVFFAMELLQGNSLMDFVEDRELSGSSPLSNVEKLALFSRICEVVSYAHQRGVIHRDLKPQNVFVTDESGEHSFGDSAVNKLRVKILDFGLARITDPDFAGATDVSQIGQIKGTLNYMSPEQLSGNPADVDVRSDVYALGVMLYEMLTGRLPYDIRQAALPEAMRIICEQQPAPLGRGRTESISEGRKSFPRVDKDVETIVLKALEKEPERRYQSVSAMIDDIERFLTDQPILARPPSALYQFRKLLLRHKAASASLATLFLMLLGFGIVMAAQSARIASERDKALLAEQTAQEQKADAELARTNEQKQRLVAEENLKRAEDQQAVAEKEKAIAEKAKQSEAEQRYIAETNLKRAQSEQRRAESEKASANNQKSIAQEQKSLAEKRQAEAEEQKVLVEEREEANRGLLYISQMNLAEQAWANADIEQVQDLLKAQIPAPGKKDLRGFEWYYLWKLSNSELWKREYVSSAVFSPAGGFLAANTVSAGEKSNEAIATSISILDQSTGREISVFKGRKVLGFLPDGRMLSFPVKPFAPEFLQKLAKQMDPAALEELVKQNDQAALQEMAKQITKGFSDESKAESTLEFLDPQTGAVQASKLKFIPSLVLRQFVSPDGKLAANQEDGYVDLWEVETGNRIISFKDEGRWNFGGFSGDGRFIALVRWEINNDKRRALVWDTSARQEYASFEGERSDFRTVALTPDGKFLASRSFDDMLTFFDVTKKRVPRRIKVEEMEPNFGSGLESLVFSPNGLIDAVVGGRAVVLGGTCGREVIKGHSKFVLSAAFSADSKKLATVGSDGMLKMWDLPDCADLQSLNGFDPAVSSDGTTLAITSRNGVKLWDITTNRELAYFGTAGGERVRLSSPRFSPDGKILAAIRHAYSAVASDPLREPHSILEFWNTASKTKIAAFEEGVGKFAFSPDGRLLVAVNRNNTSNVAEHEVHLWDVATQTRISSLGKGHSIAFAPDGKILAIASRGKVRLIDISNGEGLGSFFNVATLSQEAVKFSSDGKLLATIVDNDVVLWDFASRKEIASLKGHAGIVASMAFSPDGKRIATSSWQDESVKIWDAATYHRLFSFKLSGASSVLFSPDGQSLIVQGSSGTQIWRAASESEVAARIK